MLDFKNRYYFYVVTFVSSRKLCSTQLNNERERVFSLNAEMTLSCYQPTIGPNKYESTSSNRSMMMLNDDDIYIDKEMRES